MPIENTPSWAPRVKLNKIRRLYETDAKGIYDEDLIDDVGYGLLARCRSILDANEILRGKTRCPVCSEEVSPKREEKETLRCICDWESSLKDYQTALETMKLDDIKLVSELFHRYIREFHLARAPREKFLLIDSLVYALHSLKGRPESARPIVPHMIEGDEDEAMALIDTLAISEKSTPGSISSPWRKGKTSAKRAA